MHIFILCMWKCYRKNHIWSSTNYARESVIAKITFEVSRIFCDLSSNVLFVISAMRCFIRTSDLFILLNFFCMNSNTYTFRAILFFYLKECFVSYRFHNIFILCAWKCYRKNHIWSFTNLLSAKTYKLIHTFDSQMSQILWLPILRLQMCPKREHICL